jgi:phosphoribosylformylglycinamidine cyclo-ligase
VLSINDEIAIAVCTDGVGSKTLVASALDRYDTIGFDCMAMNVNDMICIGARPIAMVDYLGVNSLDTERTAAILTGLAAAADEAGVAVPGGELAQLPEVIGSDGTTPGDEKAFDLVGTCIGIVHPDRLITGEALMPGDSLIGLSSSGIHSNGLTLARKTLLQDAGYALDEHLERLSETVGEALLTPTRIYVRAATTLWDAGIQTKGMGHVTGDGFTNLCRLNPLVGFDVQELPDPHPIFGLIQDAGRLPDAEMYRVFNMGVGLVVMVDPTDEPKALELLAHASYPARRLGTVTDEAGVIRIEPLGLVGGMPGGESELRTG